jgi:hypothetical protein
MCKLFTILVILASINAATAHAGLTVRETGRGYGKSASNLGCEDKAALRAAISDAKNTASDAASSECSTQCSASENTRVSGFTFEKISVQGLCYVTAIARYRCHWCIWGK